MNVCYDSVESGNTCKFYENNIQNEVKSLKEQSSTYDNH